MNTQVISRPDYLPAVGANDALAAAASAGIGGRTFKTVSIKQSRWRLVDAEGTERVIESFSIPFAVLAVNPAVSKTYYIKPYSPGDDPAGPDCASDDGRAPDAGVLHPQSTSCATCPHNVWGSAVNPTNGKQLKACKDSKRISIGFPGDPSKSAYGFRMSAMNMQNFAKFVREKVIGQGIRLDHILVKGTFDSEAEFPLVDFDVLRNMTREEYEHFAAMRLTNEAKIPAGLGEREVTVDAPVVGRDVPFEQVAAPMTRAREMATEAMHKQEAAVKAEPSLDTAMADMFSAPASGPINAPQDEKKARKPRSSVVTQAAPASDDLDALLAKALG